MSEDQSTRKHEHLILIVDDIQKNLQVLGNTLMDEKYKVAVSSSGVQALQICEETPPDLILLDVMMPDLDGYEVCARLKKSPKTKNIPIIFLTAKSETDDIVRGFSLGGVDYISKPFNRVELLTRVKTHLELEDSRREIIDLERRNSVLAMGVTANHEINQPLMALSGSLDLLRMTLPEGILTPTHNKCISDMIKSIKRIKYILNQLKTLHTVKFQNYTETTTMVVLEDEEGF